MRAPSRGVDAARSRTADRRTARGTVVAVALGVALVAGACIPPPEGGGSDPDEIAPIAVASVGASAGAAPFTAVFSSAGSADADGEIVEHRWTFGDGTESGEPNPTKVYASPGTYDVTLEVVDDDGLTDTATTFAVTAYNPGDPAALVQFPDLSRSVSLGEDRIAVWTCVVEGGDGPIHDPRDVAEWAQEAVGDYLQTVSRGRYQPVFTGEGLFPADDVADCLPEAEARTEAPFTNVMVVDNGLVGGGYGGPGFVRSDGVGSAPDLPPAESSRGFIVYGGSYSELPSPKVLIHEIGHTLHWPHSYLTPTNQYDNPVDLMSGWTTPMSCSVPGWIYQCEPQHTLALNRWASGWVDPAQVVVHTGGSRTVDLAGPESSGAQLVVAPSVTSSRALVTVEARPKIGHDALLDTGGVAVHVVDQRHAMCDTSHIFDGCPSLWRRQGQGRGAPNTYEHVVLPGQTRTVHGLTISVVGSTATGYRVTVSGAANVAANALQPRPSLVAGFERPRFDNRRGWSIDLPTADPRTATG